MLQDYLEKINSLSRKQKLPQKLIITSLFDDERYIVDEENTSITIGRNEANQIVMPDGRVSKLHCRLDFLAGKGFQITDYSRNGTFVCNEEVTNIVHMANKSGMIQIPKGNIFLGIHPRSGFNTTKLSFEYE
jgi:pSer/pThr/pTyr-binding forkhead associated (FHA) protein